MKYEKRKVFNDSMIINCLDAEMDPIAPSANFTETKTTHQAEEMKYNEKGPDLQVEVDVKHPDVIHTLDDREGLSFNTDNHSVVPGFAERDAHSSKRNKS